MATSRPSRRRRPLPGGTSLYTPDASPSRQAAEQRSARPLIYLHQLPAWVPPVIVVVFLVAGLAMHGPAATAALVVVAAALAWLAAMSWPRLAAGGKAGRIGTVAIMLIIAGYKAFH